MAAESRARVAVVTGASSGIGLEAAKALAGTGWRVIGVGRDPGRSAAAERLWLESEALVARSTQPA